MPSDFESSSSGGSTSQSGGQGTNYVQITLSPDPGVPLAFESLEGSEELGRPFLYVLEMSSLTASSDIRSWLGASVTVAFQQTSTRKRYINGIMTRAVYSGLVAGAYRYKVELRPWIWLLTRKQDCQIFQNQSAYDIITGVFSALNFSGSYSDNRQNSAGSVVLEYCVQYDETSFDFVTRLMELWGLYYYFTHADGSHTLVISDDPNCHTTVTPSGSEIPFTFQQTDYRQTDDHIWEWQADLRLHSGAYTLTDYNFETPSTDLTGKSNTADTVSHQYNAYEIFSFPGPHDTATNGQTLATVRMQDLTFRGQVFRGVTNSRLLTTGCKFTLCDAADSSLNIEYTIIQSSLSLKAAEGRADDEGELVDALRTTFFAIPGTVPFKLAQITPRPTIKGPQTAKIVGETGQEMTTDQYGRVKCKFFWDRSATQDENSSCWIRVSQLWAGLGWGAMAIPRIGQEVIVEFLEGNPDRPIITGRVYNATQTVPYALPANNTKTTIKSNSSQGGGGSNEIRFDDNKGSEEVFFQAQKDYNKSVLNNETVTITQDSTTTVSKGNRSITVSTGNNSATVSQGNDSLTVSAGNHSISVSAGTSSIEAAQSITLKVGSNSITIDTTGVTISAAKISLQGQAEVQLQSGGTMSVQSSGPMTIAGATIAIN